MLRAELYEVEGIVVLEPDGELTKKDFETASKVIDPFLTKNGELKGIIIHVKSFPGWDSFSSLVSHMKFIKEHHKKVSRVAFATDSPLGSVAENVASHFVNAKIKTFGFDEFEVAKQWIGSGDA